MDPDGDGYACKTGSQALPQRLAGLGLMLARRCTVKSRIMAAPGTGCGPFDRVALYAMDSAEAAWRAFVTRGRSFRPDTLNHHDGDTVPLVPEDQACLACGAGEWRGHSDINSAPGHPKLDNRGSHPFPEPQMAMLETLLRGSMDVVDPARRVHRPIPICFLGRKVGPRPTVRLGPVGTTEPRRKRNQPARDCRFLRSMPLQQQHVAGATRTHDIDLFVRKSTRLRFAPWRKGPLCADDMLLA